MEKKETEIDGTMLEGGGQIFRMSIALSFLTSTPVTVKNIRGKRPKPGLANQHLCGLNALSEICSAYVTGNYVASSIVTFSPGKLVMKSEYGFKCDSAGSAHLIMQMILPALTFTPIPTCISLTGGTDTSFSPTSVCVQHVLVPLLKRMGLNINYEIKKRGFFPLGGGKVVIKLGEFAGLKPLVLKDRGKVKGISIYSVCTDESHVSFHDHIVEKVGALYGGLLSHYEIDHLKTGFKKGKIPKYRATYIIIESEGGSIQKVESYWDGKGEFKNGIETDKLIASLKEVVENENVTLDEHHSDQLLVYMALAPGLSIMRVKEMSLHLETMIHLLPIFLKKVEIKVAECLGEDKKKFLEIQVKGVDYKLVQE